MDFKEKETQESQDQLSIQENQLQGGLSNNSNPTAPPDDGDSPFVDNRSEVQDQLNIQNLADNSQQN